ncbi:MAG: AAA family ATPase [Oscillospiraceae bacterium]|jgi:chromosomal replication initiator protein|nr:AAA family ATPase [Oscillospiraceae bacterium]
MMRVGYTPTDYTFDSFIVGRGNRLAHAIALRVAANPSEDYNPLFIYSASGLGKTHLLFAIQHEIEKKHPEFKICHVTAGELTEEVLSCIRRDNMAELHDKYRSCDVLLVDDVHVLCGKPATQEEFLRIFDAMYTAGKQIVISGSEETRGLEHLYDGLKSRFEKAIFADIQTPDFEARAGIIRHKAARVHFDITDTMVKRMAAHLTEDVRLIEGAVNKLDFSRRL